MPTLKERKLEYDFPEPWEAVKYDDWAFYRNQFVNCCGGNKAVDFLAYNPSEKILWLIEIKDYRQFPRAKERNLSLWNELGLKTRDTLAGLLTAKAAGTDEEQIFATQAVKAVKLRVVLHLEQPKTDCKLFPRVFDPANVQQKLKQILKPIDAHPKVVELNNMNAVPWEAASVPLNACDTLENGYHKCLTRSREEREGKKSIGRF